MWKGFLKTESLESDDEFDICCLVLIYPVKNKPNGLRSLIELHEIWLLFLFVEL